jgi:hypothetical protein
MTSMTPRHWNPLPMFGLRIRLSRTAQAIAYLLNAAGPAGIERERLPLLLYMADLHAREYLGRPITDLEWRWSA